jgi:hypothetical protein
MELFQDIVIRLEDVGSLELNSIDRNIKYIVSKIDTI